MCLEKRLVVAHELGGEGGGKAQAYGELGTLHSQLGNYEQALSCLEHQLNIARSAGVSPGAVDARELRECPKGADLGTCRGLSAPLQTQDALPVPSRS